MLWGAIIGAGIVGIAWLATAWLTRLGDDVADVGFDNSWDLELIRQQNEEIADLKRALANSNEKELLR